ncbi:hypothetical protein GP486_004714 [Trichoglossum hirsutum]|uniref:FAD-binding domain-containing protein n=1 Tax=Trichoglossum hirsutum TaxID=265104 RepID=A0A9P8LAK0_9PEZI|nr:hypothetical protein GP486_004714 [Trichoglossum hirsutum]
MTVHWSAAYLTECLPQSILDRLPEAQADQQLDFDTIKGIPMHNLETGEIIKEIPITTPRRYGKTLTNIDYSPEGGVTAHFEDGTSFKGTTLIGADGSRSATRSLLFGEKATLTTIPYVMVNVVVHYSPEHTKKITEVMHPFCHVGYHPEGTMFWISVMDNPDPADISKKTFQIISTWEGVLTPEENKDSASRLRVLRDRVGKYAPPFSDFAAWIPDDTPVHPDRMAVWEPLPLDHHAGRVTLAGDAAHNITFHRGQGLNLALHDAADFVSAMVSVRDRQRSLQDALDWYGKEMLERSAAEYKASYMCTRFVHRWDELMQSPIMKGIGVSQLKKENVAN